VNREIIVIAHNIRSCHNVGSLLRTADGLNILTVFLTGYTPYPKTSNDARLPHIISKIEKQIHKTALGAENTVHWQHHQDILRLLSRLKNDGYICYALEQTPGAIPLEQVEYGNKIVILVGNELNGLEKQVIKNCHLTIMIPMLGAKESFNVVQAAAMALYLCRFIK